MPSRKEYLLRDKDVRSRFWESTTLDGVHIMQRRCLTCNVFQDCRPVFGWWPLKGKEVSSVTASGVHMGQKDCAIKELFGG